MSCSIASSIPLPVPMDTEQLLELLDRLSDDQKRVVLQRLLPPVLASVREPRAIHDLQGRVLGYYVPKRVLTDGDLLHASVSESGTFHVTPVREADAGSMSGILRSRKKQTQDLFEVDLGGGD